MCSRCHYFVLNMKKMTFKMNTYAAIIVVGISMLALGGCEDEQPTPVLPTTTEKICAHAWEMASMPIEPALDLGGGIKLTDYMQMMQDCEKDDYYKFASANGQKTYVIKENLLKCSPADPDSTTGVWDLSADEKTVTMGGEKFKLILIDDNNMHIRVDSFMQNSSMTLKFRKR
ncbi:MAG: hypothetical protein RIS28_751 [Bacteroidota bacterium]